MNKSFSGKISFPILILVPFGEIFLNMMDSTNKIKIGLTD